MPVNVLVFTNMYPWEKMPFYGSFVRDEVESLRDSGVDVDVYFVNGRRSRANYLGMPAGFFKRVRRKRYDLIHVHHSYCGLVATLQKAVPVVWTFHEGEIMDDSAIARSDNAVKRLAYSGALKRRVARRVHTVIVVAAFLKAPLGRPDAVTLPSGIDMTRFVPMETEEAKQRLGLHSGRRYILFPSSPDRIEKRFEMASAAVEKLRANDPEASDVELICLDNVPHQQVPLYMNAAELTLMTSAFEASPVTLRESLACNVPVISTDIGDAGVILGDIEGCRTVDADPDRIALALGDALGAPRRIAARDRMVEYSLEATARRILDIYRKVIGS